MAGLDPDLATLCNSKMVWNYCELITRIYRIDVSLLGQGTIQNKIVRLIAVLYAALKCKQNKTYHMSARLTPAYSH